MKSIRASLAGIGLALALSLSAGHLVLAAGDTVSAKVGKPLQDAISAATAKRYDDALGKLRDADAISDKTPYEQFKINEIYAFVYNQQRKYTEAAVVIEKLIASGFLSPADMDTNTKQVALMYMQVKNYPKALEYVSRWVKAHPSDAEMTVYQGQLQYQSGQLKPAFDTFSGLVSGAEKAGNAPKEDWLKMMYAVSAKLSSGGSGQDKQTLSVVEKLLRYYPSETYWQYMLNGLKNQVTVDAPKFQLMRLMQAVGTLKDPSDYIEFAQLANNFGFPGESLTVIDAGYAKGILGVGGSKDRDDRLRASFKKSADDDKAALPSIEKKAAAAATGQDQADLGEVYMGYGQNQQAIDALEAGIKKGGLKRADQAQIALGIAYLRAGQSDKARAAFKQVTGDTDYAKIAALWALHASSKR